MDNFKIHLSPRLQKIADLVPQGSKIADIGTDHAYIPAYLALKGTVKGAVASDINEGPVLRAKETVKKYGLSSRIDVRLGAGLDTVSPGDADVIIIAGMGGVLISEILDAAVETVKSARLLILQPMTAAEELRQYISENSFTLLNEHIVHEDQKLYNIIVLSTGGRTDYSEAELYIGKSLTADNDELLNAYKEKEITKLRKKIEGLEKSTDPKNAQKLLDSKRLLDKILKM